MRRILIVDDDPGVVEVLSRILVGEGYEVAAVTHSLRVYDRAKESRPDLILLDLTMPYLNGVELICMFSFDDDLKDTPIIAITAETRALDGIEDPRALRIVDYLAKPFDTADLLEKVRSALAGPRD